MRFKMRAAARPGSVTLPLADWILVKTSGVPTSTWPDARTRVPYLPNAEN
jgi:hypothetical protein